MFPQPPSRLVAQRGTRGLPTITSSLAILALAGAAVGACTAPAAAGAISGPAQASFDSHRAREQQRSTALPPSSLDSWDTLRKEHQPGVTVTIGTAPVVIPDGAR